MAGCNIEVAAIVDFDIIGVQNQLALLGRALFPLPGIEPGMAIVIWRPPCGLAGPEWITRRQRHIVFDTQIGSHSSRDKYDRNNFVRTFVHQASRLQTGRRQYCACM
jgi:hypothetical protein